MTDNRVTLPLDMVQYVAESFCEDRCDSLAIVTAASGPDNPVREVRAHHTSCLVPHLQERLRMLLETYTSSAISGDCLDKAKHAACSGCGCDCHTKKRRLS